LDDGDRAVFACLEVDDLLTKLGRSLCGYAKTRCDILGSREVGGNRCFRGHDGDCNVRTIALVPPFPAEISDTIRPTGKISMNVMPTLKNGLAYHSLNFAMSSVILAMSAALAPSSRNFCSETSA
jgi:hypothetical protein